jgi:hypothetical protein
MQLVLTSLVYNPFKSSPVNIFFYLKDLFTFSKKKFSVRKILDSIFVNGTKSAKIYFENKTLIFFQTFL